MRNINAQSLVVVIKRQVPRRVSGLGNIYRHISVVHIGVITNKLGPDQLSSEYLCKGQAV